jgi:tRNA dimethylallyltransferase
VANRKSLQPCPILIAGPTASGKSALALALAEKVGGVIVNADSMQVYRDLRIITARPTPEEEARVPHRLYGHVDAAENYSTGRWLADAKSVLAEIRAAGKIPILVGGTGLYFKALTTGLSDIPPVPAVVRQHFRDRLEMEGVEALHRDLQTRDPASAARLMPRDRSRILRALEVVEATGRTLTDWHREGMPPLVDPQQTIKVFLDPDREVLKEAIARRFDSMLKAGALEEVRALDARKLAETLPAMKAHGVPWLRKVLRGEMTFEAAAEQAIIDTRQYTKRQATWFRNQMPGWVWVKPEEGLDEILRRHSGAAAVGGRARNP